MLKFQWVVPVLLLASAAVAIDMDTEDEEACRRLQISLNSLLYGSDDERLLLAETAEDAFEDLVGDDGCFRPVLKAVDRLIETESDAFLVFRFLEGWAEVDDRARPFLLALERDEAEVRQAAARAIDEGLIELDPEDLRRLLEAWRREDDPRTRLLLIDVLGGEEENQEVREELLAVACSDVPEEAAAAIDVLNILEDPMVVLEARRRPEPEVREAALRWMTGHLNAPGVLDGVLEAAKTEAPDQRARAMRALFKISDSRAVDAWRTLVLDPEVPVETRIALVSEAPRGGPWRIALEGLAETSQSIEPGLQLTAKLRAAQTTEDPIRCFYEVTSHDPTILGTVIAAPGSDLVPCLARPDRPTAIVQSPLQEGTEVYADLTWTQKGHRWLGVWSEEGDQEYRCWIEERRLVPER